MTPETVFPVVKPGGGGERRVNVLIWVYGVNMGHSGTDGH